MDYEGFFRKRLGVPHTEGGTACLPNWSGAAAAFRTPMITGLAPKWRCGALGMGLAAGAVAAIRHLKQSGVECNATRNARQG
jgi:hypothetical protein